MSDNNLPEDRQSEVAILGALMGGEDLGFFEASQMLGVEHFSVRSNRIIFEAILKLHSLGLSVEPVSLTNHIKTEGKLEEVGGAPYISQIGSCFCPLPNFRHYVDLVVEAFKLRKIIELSDAALATSKSGVVPSSEILGELESQVFSLSTANNTDNQNRLKPASEELQRMIDIRRAGQKVFGLDSGVDGFNQIFGGFQKGQYYVMAARPSVGKTAFVDQVTVHLVIRGHPVLYISLEAGEERVLGKMACKLAKVCFSDFAQGKCSPPELDEVEAARKVLDKSPLILIRPSDLNATDIRTLIRKEYRARKIELVVMDYIQKITIPPRTEPRVAIGDASQQIAKSCVDTGVPALILAQLNREADKGERPRMSQLKESGQIEQDADNVGLLWSDVDRSTLLPGAKVPINLTIEKNRDGISQLDQKLAFNGRLMTFEERKI